jgi:hypothetical protein
MKFAAVLFALAAVPAFAATGSLTDSERTFLVDQLEQTKKIVVEALSGVTPAQWQYKPAPGRWSVAECAEHIVLAEDYIFGGAQGMLKSPAVERLPSSTAETDQKIVGMVTDRSHKLTAPEPLVPGGKILSAADAIRQFTEKRDAHIAYVKSTQDDLRVHIGDSPAGKMDAYQFLLLLSAHSARHTAQIREVQASAGYPKMEASLR